MEFNDISPYKYVAADDTADGRVLTSGDGIGREVVSTRPLRGSGRVSARPNPRTGRFRANDGPASR